MLGRIGKSSNLSHADQDEPLACDQHVAVAVMLRLSRPLTGHCWTHHDTACIVEFLFSPFSLSRCSHSILLSIADLVDLVVDVIIVGQLRYIYVRQWIAE